MSKIYALSKENFYSLIDIILQIDVKKNVYIDYDSISKIFSEEDERRFIEKAIACTNILAESNPQYFEIKKKLESRL